MLVSVFVFQAGLVGVAMGVLVALVPMGVLMLDMVMIMRRVSVRMREVPVAVFVRMGVGVRVLLGHDGHLSFVPANRSPASSRWPACSALKTASTTRWRTCSFSRL